MYVHRPMDHFKDLGLMSTFIFSAGDKGAKLLVWLS